MARKLKRFLILFYFFFPASVPTIYGALIFTEYIDGRMVKTWMALLLFLISCYLLAIYNNVDITPYAHSLKEIPNKPGHVRSAAEKIFIFIFFFFIGSRNNQ